MNVAEKQVRPCSSQAGRVLDPLVEPLSRPVREALPPRRAEYVLRVLTVGELSVVGDPADALIIARIKRMPARRLRRFDALEPATASDRRLYDAMQLRWLRDEEYLLGTRLGRRPTHAELFADFLRNRNGLRFRAYFAMKYPRRMKRSEQHSG